jgi:hypothetical protein
MVDPPRDELPRGEPPNEPIPFWQRVFDNVFLMLALGLIVMFIVFTGWGLLEIYTLPQATLP